MLAQEVQAVLVVVALTNTRHRVLCTQTLGKETRKHVDLVRGSDGYKQIGFGNACLNKKFATGCVAAHRHYVVCVGKLGNDVGVVIDSHHVVIFANHAADNGTPCLAASYNDNIHVLPRFL